MFFKEFNPPKMPKNKVLDQLLTLIKSKPNVTNKELAAILDRSERQIKRYLKKLIETGIITSKLTYNSYIQNGVLKVSTTRKLHAISKDKINSKNSTPKGTDT